MKFFLKKWTVIFLCQNYYWFVTDIINTRMHVLQQQNINFSSTLCYIILLCTKFPYWNQLSTNRDSITNILKVFFWLWISIQHGWWIVVLKFFPIYIYAVYVYILKWGIQAMWSNLLSSFTHKLWRFSSETLSLSMVQGTWVWIQMWQSWQKLVVVS